MEALTRSILGVEVPCIWAESERGTSRVEPPRKRQMHPLRVLASQLFVPQRTSYQTPTAALGKECRG